MKLKEIPLSIYTAFKLLSLTKEKVFSKVKDEVPVIISLTSIPTRLTTLHLTIRSLLNQDIRPLKIVLWLHKSLEGALPKKLESLKNECFQIYFSDLTCSHRKLVHTLDQFPNTTIVTCDDDMMYRSNWLRLLYNEHTTNPNAIIANQTRYIRYSMDGELLSYKKWVFTNDIDFNEKAIIPIGAEGVLYPPNSLAKETTNAELFLKLTPKADDLWFKAMSIKNKTPSKQAKIKATSPVPIIGSQKESLKKGNIGSDKNKAQWLAVTEYFKIRPESFL